MIRNFLRVNHIHAIRVAKYATKKRFYKNTGILCSDGRYEVTLDHRKLKTPSGQPFYVESEPLALAVAQEWDAQEKTIQQSSMHLTALCSTVLDNPNHLNKIDIVNYMVNYLQTDTILFQSQEDDPLYEFQKKEWDPVIQWFCNRFSVDMKKVRGFEPPQLHQQTLTTLTKHFLSYHFAAVNGFVFGVDSLKSVILMLACSERFLSVQKAVYLSRLEEEFQIKFWGRIEWGHDLSQQDLQSRVSAALLFVHFNSSSVQRKEKAIQ